VGDPITGAFLIFAPVYVPIFTLLYGLIGLLPFLIIRRMTPRGGLARLAFVLLVLAPVIVIVCLAAGLWLVGLSFEYRYFPHQPPFANRLDAAVTHYWRGILLIGLCGSLACWGFDQKGGLFAEDHSQRLRARVMLVVVIGAILLPVALVSTCNEYVVTYRAQEIAGPRSYCILVPDRYGRYTAATQRRELSLLRMWAFYQLTTGSRGGLWMTNHALLLLDDPREFRNWSYWSENFVTEPLTNLRGFDENKPPCALEQNFVTTLK
jgi:hypothetical protein